MKLFKRILALALALMMLCTLAACNGDTPPAGTGGNDTPDSTEGTKAPDVTPSGEKRVIKIGVWWDIYYDRNQETAEDDPNYTASISDDMRFEVVAMVEEKYNVEFEYVNLTYTGVVESINTSILAGTPECDIYLCEINFGVPAALNGLALDLKTVLGEDADILSDQTVLSYLDLGDGKACLMKQMAAQNSVENTYPLAFNKQLLENANLEDPRELLARGEWTWAKFVEYCQALTQDTDGDGVVDQYGFTGFKEDVFTQLLMSNGASIAAGTTETLSSSAVGEVLQFYADLYNTYKVCEPYTWEDTGDVMRNTYRNGNVGFWPCAAWIASGNGDYGDGTTGSPIDFDTVYVQWPVGPSGNKDTNKGKLTGGSYWFIPTGVEDPELVYNVFEALSNWYLDDTSIRDDKETMWWWYSVTARDAQLQEDNFATMFDVGSREQFDLYQSLGVGYDLESLMNGTITAAQFQETYRQEFQAALDSYFGG